MDKRGGSEVDWMMSLAIFLLYVAWFFAYLKPITSPPTDADSLLIRISDKLAANTTWSVDTVPLIIKSNITGTDEPVIASFPYSWNSTSFAFSRNTTFFLDENKLLFLANLSSGKNIFMVAHSSEPYSPPSVQQKAITATSSFASAGGMNAEFRDSTLDRILYSEKYVVHSMNISLNSVKIAAENKSVTITPAVAAYKIQSQMMNHTSYVFAENSRIYNVIKSNKPLETRQNLSIAIILSNLTDYYADTKSGELDFNSTCNDFASNYLDLYDASVGITFIFNDEANISLCAANSTISVTASFMMKNETMYNIILHQGIYNRTLKYKSPYKTGFGIIEKQSGLSARLLASLNSTNYSSLKSAWAYPAAKKFSFAIVNVSNSPIYSYELVIPDAYSNVFVKETDRSIVDQYGNRQRVTVRVKGW